MQRGFTFLSMSCVARSCFPFSSLMVFNWVDLGGKDGERSSLWGGRSGLQDDRVPPCTCQTTRPFPRPASHHPQAAPGSDDRHSRRRHANFPAGPGGRRRVRGARQSHLGEGREPGTRGLGGEASGQRGNLLVNTFFVHRCRCTLAKLSSRISFYGTRRPLSLL